MIIYSSGLWGDEIDENDRWNKKLQAKSTCNVC